MKDRKFALAILFGVLFGIAGNLLITSFFNLVSLVEFPRVDSAIINFLLLTDSGLGMIYLVKWVYNFS
jgi:hypothetical protein